MKLTVNTIQLQNAVAKATKCSGFNKLLPITGMMGIKFTGTELVFTTTDGTNFLYITLDVGSSEAFDVTVDAEIFSKLVSKLTSEQITLEVTDSYLLVSGNGDYKLSLQLNDDGNNLVYPDPLKDVPVEISDLKISKVVIDMMLNALKPSLSQVVGSVYTNYYVGKVLATTDKVMLGIFDDKVIDDDLLFSRSFVDLLGLATDDVAFELSGDYMIARCDDMTLCAKKSDNVTEYNVEGLNKMLGFEFDAYCKVNKSALLATLERLAIFVGQYDDSAINIHFTNTGMELSSLNSSGVETVDFMEVKNAKDMTIKINILRLIIQLKAYASDSVDIYYGNEKLIKLNDGKLTQVIALIV